MLVASILPCVIHIVLMKKQLSTLNIVGDVALASGSVVIMVSCTIGCFKSMLEELK